MPTIKDVAGAAGVSVATVSRVINRSGSVLPETIERVQQAMLELGYQVKGNRRLMVNQGEDTLGLIINNFNSPFFGQLAQGVEKVARRYGRKVVISSGHYEAESEEESLKFLLGKGCRNVVFHSKAMSDELLRGYALSEPGLILVNRRVTGVEPQCVWLENNEGGYRATRYLLDQGHKRVAFIGCELDIEDKTERLAGYRRALAEVGVEPNPDWIEEVPFGEHGGAMAATNLLNKGLPVSAVVAYNDFFAAAAIQVFSEHGVSVPEQLSVVGFDDVLPQCYFTPKLTTVRNPIESMAMNAARLSIEGHDCCVSREFVPLLVKRESVSGY